MKILKIFFLFFPLLTFSQNKFDSLREKLQQNKTYEYVYGFENNYAVFRTFNDKMGVIDSLQNVIIQPVFSFIHNKKELINLFEVGNDVNKKFRRGFIDLKGNIKIPIIYDDVYYAENNIIIVTKENKFGVLDTLNKSILPVKFDYIYTSNNLIIARTKEKSDIYNFQGKKLSNLSFSEISDFIYNKAIITFHNKSTSIIDNIGTILLKSDKNYNFKKVLNNNLYIIKSNQNSKEGVLNSKEDIIIKCKYDELKLVKTFYIAKSKNKKGFISLTDSILKPIIYDEIFFSNLDEAVTFGDNNIGDNFIVIKDNLFGVLNPSVVKDVIPLNYKYINTLFDSYYIVQNNENKNGLFFKNGEKILNEDYKFYNVFENSIFTTKNNKAFLVKLEENKFKEIEIFVDEFVKFKDELEFAKNANQIFKSKGKFGVINYKNNVIIPCEYELIENIYLSKEFIVKKNNKFGIVNSENKVIVEIEYDGFKKLKEVILFTKDKKIIKKSHQIIYR